MKTSEKIYSAFPILMCGLLTFSIATFVFYIIPRTETDAANMFKGICVLTALYAIALGTTAYINLKTRELKTVPTVIQIIVLFLTAYGIPFGIWGIVLLIKHNKNATHRMEIDA